MSSGLYSCILGCRHKPTYVLDYSYEECHPRKKHKKKGLVKIEGEEYPKKRKKPTID